jgi:enoyl-[acyl-carrier protein] reductase I
VGVQSARFRPELERLTATWPVPPLIVECDVAQDTSVNSAAAAVSQHFNGALDALAHSIAYAPATAMRAPLIECSRADFALSHDLSAYSLVALTRALRPSLEAAGSASVTTFSFLGSTRVRTSWRASLQVYRSYSVMGPAKASLEATARQLAVELVGGCAALRARVPAAYA